MPAAPQGVVIEPNGQTVVVTFVEQGGGTPTVYADRNGQSTIALPATITVRTKFFFEVGTVYTVSCKVSGLENANGAGGTATVDLTGGGVASLGVSTPVETPTVASGTYALKTETPTLEELFATSKFLGNTETNNITASYPIFTAPFACQITSAVLVGWNTGTYAQSDTNYFSFEIRRYHLGTSTTIASGINTKVTGGVSLQQRIPQNFDAATWVAGITLAKGDQAVFAMLATGTPVAYGPHCFVTLGYVPV